MKNFIFSFILIIACYITNAQTWIELGGLNGLGVDSTIFTSCTDPSGNVYAAGLFVNASGKRYVAKWNGTTWSELGNLNGFGLVSGLMRSVYSDAAGNIYAGGSLTNSSGNFCVTKWDGVSWSELGGLNGLSANNVICSICSDNVGNIYAAGAFTNSSGHYYVAKWNGTTWSELGGLNGLPVATNPNNINCICSDPTGNIYATGMSNPISGGGTYIAKWDGTTWSQVGGLAGIPATGNALTMCCDAMGNLYAAGNFYQTPGHKYVAKWNGTAWSEVGIFNGSLVTNTIASLCVDMAGNLYATGGFNNASGNKYVAKWNGTAWCELGGLNSLAPNPGNATVCSDALGNIYTAGYFSNSSGNRYVAKFSCTTAFDTVNHTMVNGSSYVFNGDTLTVAGIYKDTLISTFGCDSIVTLILTVTPNGLTEIGSNNSIRAIPNPTSNTVTISSDKIFENASITVLNITGGVIAEYTNISTNEFVVDLSKQSKGMYFVKLKQVDKLYYGKVMKE